MEAAIKQLLEVTLLSSAMIAVVLALRKIFRDRLTVSMVSLLWLLVMIRLLMPISLEVPVHINIARPESAQTATEADGGWTTTESATLGTVASPEALETMPDTETAAATTMEQPYITWLSQVSIWQMMFGVWATGAAAALAVTVRRIVMFAQKIKKRSLLSGKTVAQMAYLGGNALSLYRNVLVYECEYIDSPITCGVVRPKILLPVQLDEQIGETKTGLILFHELVHIKRQDVLKNYLWLIAKIIYWFNPLVYAASNAFLEDIEIACDEVVKKKHSRAQMLEYSQGLLDVIRLSQGEIKLPTAISFCKDTTKIRKRVENMLKPKRKSKLMMTITLILMAAFAFGCFTTACRPEQTDAVATPAVQDITETETMGNTTAPREESAFTPVGTEENAMAIVKAHNLTGTDKFRYDELMDDILPFHIINSADGTGTLYQIYDFNGEILQAAIESNFNENKATISEEEAVEMVQPIIDRLYDDVELTVTSCVLSRGSFFDISGTLYKPSEGSTRKFGMSLNGDGEFCAIIAPYDALYVVGASDELRSKVLAYSQIDDVELKLHDVDTSSGEAIYTIALNGTDSPTMGDQMVKINASDLSLLEYTSYLGRTNAHLTMADYQIENAARSLIADYYPMFSNVVFKAVEKSYSEGSVLAEAVGCDGQIYVSVWADGSIKTIKLIDPAGGSKASADKAQEAMAKLKEYYVDLTAGKDMTLLRVYNDLSNENNVVYEFMYQSANPSIRDYSFVAAVTHDTENDRYYAKISPDYDEISIISEDEAIEKARQIIAEREGIDPKNLQKIEYCGLEEMSILYYEVSFLYDNTGYSVRLYADTGEPEGGSELHLD